MVRASLVRVPFFHQQLWQAAWARILSFPECNGMHVPDLAPACLYSNQASHPSYSLDGAICVPALQHTLA